MSGRKWWVAGILGFISATAGAQAPGNPNFNAAVTPVAPAWQPVNGAPRMATSVPATSAPSAPANAGTVYAGSPYYGVAPIYQSGGMLTTFLPQTVPSNVSTMPMPAATVSGGRPTIVPDQFITPMVQTSNGLVRGTPGVVAPLPAPSTASVAANSVFPTIAPTYTPVAPVTSTPPPTSPAPASPAAPPIAPAQQPLADPNVFVSGGQEWMDVDLTPYTKDFPEGSGAERSVREWIVQKFDPSTWTGNQVSSLVVTPSHVKVYHTPAVQRAVCDLLVRFLYYKPGTFQSQVRVVSTRDTRWLAKYQPVLLPAGQNGTNGRVWIVRGEDAKEMITSLGGGMSGTLLANPDAVVMNGQHLTVDWSPQSGRKCDPNGTGKPTEDGVLVSFSPLIDVDAATVEMDVSAAVRRTTAAASSWGTPRGEYQPDVSATELRELVKIPPGQVLVASLGKVPDFDGGKGLLGQQKVAEILVFIACQPSPGNMVSGRPVEVAQASFPTNRPVERQVAARPNETELRTPSASTQTNRSTAATSAGRRPPRTRGVPFELTQSVD